MTFNTFDRRAWLAQAPVHEAFKAYGRRGMAEFNIALGLYLLMPDHCHLFVRGNANFSLGQWVKGLKRALQMPASGVTQHWQTGFMDHLLRNDESYRQKWLYVKENPVRAGLVKDSAGWPFQGEIVVIDRA